MLATDDREPGNSLPPFFSPLPRGENPSPPGRAAARAGSSVSSVFIGTRLREFTVPPRWVMRPVMIRRRTRS